MADYGDYIQTIGRLVGKNPNVMKAAIYHGLDVNGLIQFEIPDNIVGIYRELRDNGLLK